MYVHIVTIIHTYVRTCMHVLYINNYSEIKHMYVHVLGDNDG